MLNQAGSAVAGGLVEDPIRAAGRDPEAHGRQLDVHPAGVERHIYDLPASVTSKAPHLEDHGQGKERAIMKLEAGAGPLLVLGDGRAD